MPFCKHLHMHFTSLKKKKKKHLDILRFIQTYCSYCHFQVFTLYWMTSYHQMCISALTRCWAQMWRWMKAGLKCFISCRKTHSCTWTGTDPNWNACVKCWWQNAQQSGKHGTGSVGKRGSYSSAGLEWTLHSTAKNSVECMQLSGWEL